MTAANSSEAPPNGQGEALVLPIITRAWCVRDQPTLRRPQRQPGTRPRKFIAIRVIEVAPVSMPETPPATLGVASIGYIHGSDWDATREIWFYNPATASPETIEACRTFIAANTMLRGRGPDAARVWHDDPAVTVKLITIEEFLRTFYAIAADKKKALIVGYNLLATFGALAAFWGRARPRHPKSRRERLLRQRLERLKEKRKAADVARSNEIDKELALIASRLRWMTKTRKRRLQCRPARPGRWSLALVAEPDPATGQIKPARYLPRILVGQVGAAGIVASWGSVPRGCRRGTAELLDLANLGHGLTHEHFQFAEAIHEFFPGRAGQIPDTSPAGIRATGQALAALAETLVNYFDLLHPGLTRANGGPLAENKVYGPGGIARAYAREAGYTAPAVAPEWVGFCAEANHGAWCGIGVRGRVPVVPTDIRRQYTTIFARQGIGDLLACRRLDFVEATDEIPELAAGPVTLGPHLNAVCLVNLRGEPMMVRALFKRIEGREPDAEDFTLAMALRHAEQVPAYLADVIASRILYGRAPEIIKAWKIVAVEPRALRHINLMGRRIDPAETPIPMALAEEGERLKRRLGRFGKGPLSAIPDEVRKLLVSGIKAAGNIFAYGMLLQTNQIDLPRGKHGEGGTEEATLLHARGDMRRGVRAPEEDAEFTCVPLAGLVAASGRLWLARLQRAITDRGSTMACWDTDSGHPVATPEGGIVEIEQRGADGKKLSPEHVKALSWREVDDIVAGFEAENPFDKSLLPGSALRLTDENFDEDSDERLALEGLYISPKRYCLIAPDGMLSDTKASLIGIPLPPVPDFVNDVAWRWLTLAFAGKASKPPSWFATPVVREMQVSTPDLACKLSGRKSNGHKAGRNLPPLDCVYPGLPYLATAAHHSKPIQKEGRLTLEIDESRTVVAPFSDDPAAWAGLPWRFLDGEPMSDEWEIETWGRFMSAYMLASAPAMLGPDGKAAGAYTRGVLRPRRMRDGRHFFVLKEGAEYGDDPEHAFDLVASEMFSHQSAPVTASATCSDGASREREADERWGAVRAAIEAVGPEAVAKRLAVATRTVRAWMADKNRPEDIGKIEGAICGAALAGLGLAAECKALPKALLLAQRFNTMTAIMLAPHFGGRAALAALLDMSLRAFDLAIAERSVAGKSMAAFLVRLGRLPRRDIRLPKFDDGRRGDRIAIVALLSLLLGSPAPVVMSPEWCLALPETVTGGDLERLSILDAHPSGWVEIGGKMERVGNCLAMRS